VSKVIQYHYGDLLYSFTIDGWFNATEAAARFGKLVNEWLRLPATAAYLAAFERRYGKIPHVKTSRARADRGGGADILLRHLALVTAIAYSACELRDFESRMTALPMACGQMGLLFPERGTNGLCSTVQMLHKFAQFNGLA